MYKILPHFYFYKFDKQYIDFALGWFAGITALAISSEIKI